MDFVNLGRTKLRVSAMGLGCGGHSRLGLSLGKTEAEAEAIVRGALDIGVNFIDSAESYGTESVVGKAIKGVARGGIVLSSKAGVGFQDRLSTPKELRDRVEASLIRFGVDYIDIFHLHGVVQSEYSYATESLVPELQSLRDQGKIRFIGITEQFGNDTTHEMLREAVKDDCWDVMMVGFSILNQSARDSILPITQLKGIGTLDMFAVRRMLSRPELLKQLVERLVQEGKVDKEEVDVEDPFRFLVEDGVAQTIPDAAYRFCRWEPGIDVVLSGTSDLAHLQSNAESICAPALPERVTARLNRMFQGLDTLSGN